MDEFAKALLSENHYGKEYEESIEYVSTANSLAKLRKEIAETVNIYPDFNLEKELENEEFKRFLNIGVPIKNAYEVIHIDEIVKRSESNDKR